MLCQFHFISNLPTILSIGLSPLLPPERAVFPIPHSSQCSLLSLLTTLEPVLLLLLPENGVNDMMVLTIGVLLKLLQRSCLCKLVRD